MLITIIAIFFAALGILIKHFKMYFLIAGFNTLSAQEKEKYDIEGIATVFRNGFVSMGLALIILPLLQIGISPDYAEFAYIMFSVFSGTTYILIRVNSKKYRIEDKGNKTSS